MARHVQPREVAELKGAHKKDPQRYRGKVVKSPYALGEAPERMSEDAKAAWFEISSYALPGVLTGADRLVMEIVSNMVAEYWRSPDDFPAAKHNVLKGHIATLGLNPSDRQRFTQAEDEQDNPFANL